MKTTKTNPPILIFCTRAVIPLGLAALGEAIFLAQSWPMLNGLWLFGAAGVCVGYAIEQQLSAAGYDDARRDLMREVEWLTGTDLSDEERAGVELIRRRLEVSNHE